MALVCVACTESGGKGTQTDSSDLDTGTSAVAEGDTGDDDDDSGAMTCNGRVDLCDRRFDEVVFAATHNSYAALAYGFSSANANHETGLAPQLQAGVRAMMLDVTYDGGSTALCHGPCSFGSLPHVQGLEEIAAFLETHPREMLTIIYQDGADTEDIVADLEATGLDRLVYTHVEGDVWPTLDEMIAADHRLVVTAERQGPPPAWFHHAWDLVWDTPYTFMSIDAMNCDLNRGMIENDLMLVNHWVNNEFNLPDPSQAAAVNAEEVLTARVAECEQMHGRRPNFVAVDWWETGDLFAVVDRLNDR